VEEREGGVGKGREGREFVLCPKKKKEKSAPMVVKITYDITVVH